MPAGETEIRPSFDTPNKKANNTVQQPSIQNPLKVDSSKNKRFAPTCQICGEKHWPFNQSVPCLNAAKAKVKKKEQKRILAEARKKAKAEAKAKARNERATIAEKQVKYEVQQRAKVE